MWEVDHNHDNQIKGDEVLVCIRKQGGKTTANAFCDKCGNGFEWGGHISVTRIEWILRKSHGWTTGKQHLCEKCRKPQLKGSGVAVG
jgi:hypothetical protein